MHSSFFGFCLMPQSKRFFYGYLCCLIFLDIFHKLIFSCSKNLTIKFARRTDVMPPVPLQTKHHPSAVDLLLIKRLIAETTKQNLLQFLQHEFVNISKSHAERLIGELSDMQCGWFGPWKRKTKSEVPSFYFLTIMDYHSPVFQSRIIW